MITRICRKIAHLQLARNLKQLVTRGQHSISGTFSYPVPPLNQPKAICLCLVIEKYKHFCWK